MTGSITEWTFLAASDQERLATINAIFNRWEEHVLYAPSISIVQSLLLIAQRHYLLDEEDLIWLTRLANNRIAEIEAESEAAE